MNSIFKQEARIDLASFVTLLITVVLFLVALVEKGFTRNVLLEAGVFLISVKLVLASHRIALSNKIIDAKLDELLRAARKRAA